MVTQDRDEELALFLEMRRREKEQGASLLTGSDNGSTIETVSSLRYPSRRTAAENFLYSENEKSDYEWLLTPPGTPQFEKESHRSAMALLDVPNARPTVLKSRLGSSNREELVSKTNVSSKHPMSCPGLNSSDVSGIRRPSSSGGLKFTGRPSSSGGVKSTSRPSTPTRRSTTPSTTKPSSSRSSTPTSRPTLTTTRPTGPIRSATPTRSMPRSSSIQSLPATKSVSRSATPTRRPSTPSGPSTTSKATAPVNRPALSRGTSPTVRSKVLKPPELPGFSLEAPPNLRTTIPNRPLSALRGRPGASVPNSRSNSMERSEGRVRRQSCSPSRGRNPNLTAVPLMYGRGKTSSNGDNVSPVAMGTKMVERVVNMRKLAPPRQTGCNGGGSSGKPGSSSSFDSLGYGRSFSKSSLDMALRHMDIRPSVRGNLRPVVTKVRASSMYSVRSTNRQPASVSDSPVATSSTASSEPSVNNVNILCLDGNEAENDDLLC